jgi:hypothetical protein
MISTYFTNPSTDTVHIAPEGAWALHHKTFCGRPLEGLVSGDETITGFSATCETCKHALRAALAESGPLDTVRGES